VVVTVVIELNKKAVLSQGNRTMPQLFVTVYKTVVMCKIKHLQNICTNVLVFYFHVATSKNVVKMF